MYHHFNETSFALYFKDKVPLMKVILASFSVRPHIDSNNATSEEEQLALAQDEINSHFSYHTSKRFSDLEIEKAFFDLR